MSVARFFDTLSGVPRIVVEGAGEPSRQPLADPGAALRQTLLDMGRAGKGSDAQRLAGRALAEAADWTEARVWLTGQASPHTARADALLADAGVPLPRQMTIFGTWEDAP